MSILPFRRQQSLFSWQDIEELGDLRRLQLVLDHLPDEDLMLELESERGPRGRDDYPVRAMWNSLLAMVVFDHVSVESLRRELSRNAQMRWVCGFSGSRAPSASAYSRFLGRLQSHIPEVESMFSSLAEMLSVELPDYGSQLAVDGKAIGTHARDRRRGRDPDGRRDVDADVGVKSYIGHDGTRRESSWFGYRVHLIADTTYELPVAYRVTPASHGETTVASGMLEDLSPTVRSRSEVLVGDRGYDNGGFIGKLWNEHGIRPVIDIRRTWRDEPEETRALGDWLNVRYDWRGEVYCHCPRTGVERRMAYGGFESDRGTRKYRCPAWQYTGVHCAGRDRCGVRSCLRVKMAEDPRRFGPMPHGTARWGKHYARRSSVERINSRLDVSFGFERHYIRGLRKMQLRMGMALAVMLSMALGHIREGRLDHMRSLVEAA